MKYLIPLLLCFRCVAQLPVIPATGTGGATTTFNLSSITNLFIELVSYDSRSLTNFGNGNNITNWIDLSGQGNRFTNGDTSALENAFYSTTGGPAGQPSVHFGSSGSANGALISIDTLSNQPNTFYFCAKLSQTANGANNAYRFMDSTSGGREVFQASPGNSGENSLFFAGSVVNGPNLTNAMWMVWTAVFNGTSSILRTNWGVSTNGGAFMGNSSISTGAQGKMIIGYDNSGSRCIQGDIVCIIGCSAVHSTNYMQTVEQGIRSHYGF